MPDPEVLITDPHGCFRVVRSPVSMPDGEPYFRIEVQRDGEWREKVEPWKSWDACAVQLLATELHRLKNPVTVTDDDGEAD